MHRIALAVADDLDLNVARPVDEALDEDGAVAEGRLGDAGEMWRRCGGEIAEKRGRCRGDAGEMQGRCEGDLSLWRASASDVADSKKGTRSWLGLGPG